jgi:hypothetical protein
MNSFEFLTELDGSPANIAMDEPTDFFLNVSGLNFPNRKIPLETKNSKLETRNSTITLTLSGESVKVAYPLMGRI